MTKIMLVDDDPFALGMTEAVMDDAGFAVLAVESGAEALARLAAEPDIAVVISDMNMPEMDGLALFAALRGQGYQRPFVLLTGDEAEPLRLAHPEITAVITKNADFAEQLPELINNLSAAA